MSTKRLSVLRQVLFRGFTRTSRKKPKLQSPTRKLREIPCVIPEPYSLGSRLGLPEVRCHSAHHQHSRLGLPGIPFRSAHCQKLQAGGHATLSPGWRPGVANRRLLRRQTFSTDCLLQCQHKAAAGPKWWNIGSAIPFHANQTSAIAKSSMLAPAVARMPNRPAADRVASTAAATGLPLIDKLSESPTTSNWT